MKSASPTSARTYPACSGPCEQGKRQCPTQDACSAVLNGGTFWPKLAEVNPHQIDYCDSEPMSEAAKAFCYGAIAFAVTAIISALLYSLWLSR